MKMKMKKIKITVRWFDGTCNTDMNGIIKEEDDNV